MRNRFQTKNNFRLKLLFFLCLTFSLSLHAQERKNITGTVTDPKGETIIGASVTVAGTTQGTITNIDGRFSLTVDDGAALTVSSLGYETLRVSVDGKSDLQITLKEDTKMLDEVVVVGYGVVRKKDLTGSTVSVGSAVVKDKPVSNIAEALQGRAAGVMLPL